LGRKPPSSSEDQVGAESPALARNKKALRSMASGMRPRSSGLRTTTRCLVDLHEGIALHDEPLAFAIPLTDALFGTPRSLVGEQEPIEVVAWRRPEFFLDLSQRRSYSAFLLQSIHPATQGFFAEVDLLDPPSRIQRLDGVRNE